MLFRFRRLYALLLRQFYLIRRSPPRLIAYAFWPTMDMVIWGFLNKFLYINANMATYGLSMLLGARLLYSFSERSHIQIMWGFLEDIWARNIGNILISPIYSGELISGLILNGLIAAVFGMSCAYIVAYFLFDYSVFQIGKDILPIFIILTLNSWWIGLGLVSLVIRYGSSGETFGWMAGFIIAPFIAVFYPVTVLPIWMQKISWLLPPTYVFESLRNLILTHSMNMNYFYKGLGLCLVYLVISVWHFNWQLNAARIRGRLLNMSE